MHLQALTVSTRVEAYLETGNSHGRSGLKEELGHAKTGEQPTFPPLPLAPVILAAGRASWTHAFTGVLFFAAMVRRGANRM